MISSATKSFPSGLTLKAWVLFTSAGAGAPVMVSNGNVSAVARLGVGVYGITFAQALSSAAYIVIGKTLQSAYTTEPCIYANNAPTVASINIAMSIAGAAQDSTAPFYVEIWG